MEIGRISAQRRIRIRVGPYGRMQPYGVVAGPVWPYRVGAGPFQSVSVLGRDYATLIRVHWQVAAGTPQGVA